MSEDIIFYDENGLEHESYDPKAEFDNLCKHIFETCKEHGAPQETYEAFKQAWLEAYRIGLKAGNMIQDGNKSFSPQW